MNYKTYHTPVLLNYLLKNFNLSVNSIVFDGTVGFGGHAEAILNQFPDISYYGFDKDPFAIKSATKLKVRKPLIKLINLSVGFLFKKTNY